MRTIIELTPEQVDGLARFQRRKGLSRAAAVREAVDRLIQMEDGDSLDGIFGAWSAAEAQKVRKIISALRSEWDRA